MTNPEVVRPELENEPTTYFDILALAVAKSSHTRFKSGNAEWTRAIADAQEATQDTSPEFLRDVAIDRINEPYIGPFSHEVSEFLRIMRMSGAFSSLTTVNESTYIMSQDTKAEFLEEITEQLQVLEEPIAKLTEIIDIRLGLDPI